MRFPYITPAPFIVLGVFLLGFSLMRCSSAATPTDGFLWGWLTATTAAAVILIHKATSGRP